MIKKVWLVVTTNKLKILRPMIHAFLHTILVTSLLSTKVMVLSLISLYKNSNLILFSSDINLAFGICIVVHILAAIPELSILDYLIQDYKSG
jgi:hypothetical protein